MERGTYRDLSIDPATFLAHLTNRYLMVTTLAPVTDERG